MTCTWRSPALSPKIAKLWAYPSDGVFDAPIVAVCRFANADPAMGRICVRSFDSVKGFIHRLGEAVVVSFKKLLKE